jgi:glycerophosphoryl diester phosphodiesterase
MRSVTPPRRNGLRMSALFVCAALWTSCRDSGHSTTANGAARRPLDVPPGLLVAHALGDVDGIAYSNSLEALRCNYKRGFRWFEVDLALTQDEELVAFHTDHEKRAGLDKPIRELPFSEVQRARYRKKFAIVRFVDVLREAKSLGGVVLVTDTKGWSPTLLAAVESSVKAMPPADAGPHIVLQSYGEKDIEAVAHLAKEIGAGVILTLYQTRATDSAVVDMATRHGVVAVVVNHRRFSPWLADRLHASQIPILVHTVNEHERMVKLTRAGADGFYTDTYVPYGVMTGDRTTLLECEAAPSSVEHLRWWLERDLMNPEDYRLSSCAERRKGKVELEACDDKPAIRGSLLPVPAGGHVHVDLEVEAPSQSSSFWFQIRTKDGTKPGRPEKIHLEPGERRKLTWDVSPPLGSPGLETRLGMSSRDARVVVHRLTVTLKPASASDAALIAPSPGKDTDDSSDAADDEGSDEER